MAPTPPTRPFMLVWLVAAARLIPVGLVCGPFVAARLAVAVVVSLVLLAFVPARLVAVVAAVPGWQVRIGLVPLVPCALVTIGVLAVVPLCLVPLGLLARAVVAIKFITTWLTGNSMLG